MVSRQENLIRKKMKFPDLFVNQNTKKILLFCDGKRGIAKISRHADLSPSCVFLKIKVLERKGLVILKGEGTKRPVGLTEKGEALLTFLLLAEQEVR